MKKLISLTSIIFLFISLTITGCYNSNNGYNTNYHLYKNNYFTCELPEGWIKSKEYGEHTFSNDIDEFIRIKFGLIKDFDVTTYINLAKNEYTSEGMELISIKNDSLICKDSDVTVRIKYIEQKNKYFLVTCISSSDNYLKMKTIHDHILSTISVN